MLLFGAPFFFLRTIRLGSVSTFGSRACLWASLALLVGGAIVSASAQTAIMFDEAAAAFRPYDIASVLRETQVGRALVARLMLALVVALLLALRWSDRLTWKACVVLGGAIAATFAWSGHGAATDGLRGTVHLASDIIHTLAAALWLGALPPLLDMLRRARRQGATIVDWQLAHDSLAGFAGVGTIAVGILAITGLANSWFLVGPANLGRLPVTPYGQLLLAKLALFGLMLALASANRFWFTPALSRHLQHAPDGALRVLQSSLLLETGAGLCILGVVSLLGTLPPVAIT